MKLLPSTVHQYDEYWKSIQRYNAWFIELRWYASFCLLASILTLRYLFNFSFTSFQFYSYIIVALAIVSYNYLFFLKSKNFNRQKEYLSTSLLQIILDLTALSILVYFTGGVEAPLFLLYVFHMIIGSLILPKRVMYFIAVVLILFLSVFSTLEYYNVIPHQSIVGLYQIQLYKSEQFVIGFLSFFSFVLLMIITITSKITGELYSRESQLKRAIEELNAAEKTKQKFIMAFVHDLKSPIAAAVSNLEIITGKYLGEVNDAINDKLSRIKIRLEGLIEMVNNTLRVSRFKLMDETNKEELKIRDIINSVLEKNVIVAERKNVKVVFSANEETDILGDKVLLELVLSNLISNAVKYTPENGNIDILLHDNDGNRVISISDDGIGIPNNELERIFDEFYRASNVKEIEGTGTGLVLVKQIVELHGGSITCKSPSKIASITRPGSEFTITLPLK